MGVELRNSVPKIRIKFAVQIANKITSVHTKYKIDSPSIFPSERT